MAIFERLDGNGSLLISFEATDLVMAGWTGRDQAAVRQHIDELKACGVEPPSRTPLFYRVDPALLAGSVDGIKVVGGSSSGEVEVVLLQMDDGLWVGLGSDQTDRAFEVHSVQLSKQLCRKPMAETLWSYDEIQPHWDELVLRSYIREHGEKLLYQEGSLAEFRAPDALIEAYLGERGMPIEKGLPAGSVIFCGTLPTIGGIRPANSFEMILEDPVKQRQMAKTYVIDALPAVA